MNHLDNPTINLYLDDALDAVARARADAHLAVCPVCAGELASLRALTTSFDAWQTEPIPHDLSVRVMQRVAQRPAPVNVSRWGAFLLAAQTLVAVGLFIWLLPILTRLLAQLTNISLPSVALNPFPDVSVWIGPLGVALPSFDIWVWGLVLGGGAVVWLVVNRLILSSLNRPLETSK
ncbi:MAG: zf-HC2 domain-containing protein [Anaerolineae bacterium]|nr:zf-HC2 domain-containing protein [Anaerolineae bacterium]